MERMQCGSVVDDTLMVRSAYAGAFQWTCSGLKFAAMDVEADLVFVYREAPFFTSSTFDRLVERRAVIDPPDQETRCSRFDIDTFEPEGSGCGRSIRHMPTRIRAALFQSRCDFRRLRSEVLFVHNTIQGDYESHDS
jgi:hypothetical protein